MSHWRTTEARRRPFCLRSLSSFVPANRVATHLTLVAAVSRHVQNGVPCLMKPTRGMPSLLAFKMIYDLVNDF
jgi:hypothetical protein